MRRYSNDSLAWRVTAVLLVGIVFLFGAPLGFDVLLPLGALAGGMFLIVLVLGIKPGGKRIVLGVTLVLIAGFTTYRSMTTPRPQPPADMPVEVLRLPIGNHGLGNNRTYFVMFYEADGSTPLALHLDTVPALGGYVAHFNASIDAGALGGTIRLPDKPPSWGDTITTRTTSARTGVPILEFQLALSSAHVYQTFNLSGRADVVYPRELNSSEYEEHEERLSRQVQIYVASPDDGAFRARLDDWSTVNTAATSFPGPIGLAGMFIGGGLMALVGFMALWGMPVSSLWASTPAPDKKKAAPAAAVVATPSQAKPAAAGRPNARPADSVRITQLTGMVLADTTKYAKPDRPLPPGVVIVKTPAADTPAADSGLHAGDILLMVNGERVPDIETLQRIAGAWDYGAVLELGVQRGDKRGRMTLVI